MDDKIRKCLNRIEYYQHKLAKAEIKEAYDKYFEKLKALEITLRILKMEE